MTINGTVAYPVTDKPAQLFAPAGTKLTLHNGGTALVWLSTRGNVKPGKGIPLAPAALGSWDADKDCYAVCDTGLSSILTATDNGGAINYNGPSLTEIVDALPSTADIADAVPSVAELAAAVPVPPIPPTSAQNAAATIAALPLTALQALYGDGSDGALTIGTDVTLLRDVNYTTLTVSSGGRIRTNGFRVRASVALNVNAGGLITNDGADATYPAGPQADSVGGLGAPKGTLAGGGKGGGSAWGDLGTSAATAGQPGGNADPGMGGQGGKGGDPYYSGTVPGGGGGLSTDGPPVPAFPLGQLAAATALGGGGGGGGGGQMAQAAGDFAGGGGGGGGVIVVAAPAITNNGTIRANGGKGGDSNPGFGSGGGMGAGGGGGGGLVYVIASAYGGGGAATATGGAGGAGTAPDPNVNKGNPGRPGYVLRITP